MSTPMAPAGATTSAPRPRQAPRQAPPPAASPPAAPLSAGEAADRALDLVLQSGATIRDAVSAVLGDAALSEGAVHDLIRAGLRALVSDRMVQARGTDSVAQALGRFQWNSKPAPEAMRDILQRVVLEGADGRQKPLAAFTLKDCSAFHAVASKQAVAWQTRRTLMAHALEAMERTQAATLAALPADDLVSIRDLASRAWTGGRAE